MSGLKLIWSKGLSFWVVFMTLGVVLLASCTSSPTTEVQGTSPIEDNYPAPATEVTPQDSAILTEESSPTETVGSYPVPEDQVGPTAPLVKEGLEATDPSTVQLASGKPHLVEFFAFW